MTEPEREEDRQLYAAYSDDLGLYIDMVLKAGEVESITMAGKEPEEPHGTDHPYLKRVIEHLSSGGDDLRDITVRLRPSGFDREVLEALRDIPPGEVVTYGNIAKRVGRPGAARAVGNACARNPVPIIIPCHRVVPASGGLGNYSGGEGQDTKAAILSKEREYVSGERSKKRAVRTPGSVRSKK
jgi:methylated-DNA-[protein]-cysteine S-methyltransferase